MSSTVIKAENVSKLYRLGEVGTGTITHDLNRWWAKVRGQEDPFAKIGEANDRTKKGESDYVWSLKDIDFEIKQGEAVGIIGRNGAGKSTLLKLLSKVTAPTTGKIKVKGRIASLLEVGTGFHPELTGRENIFLNGAILGMRKEEIKGKFDEIVDFSGVERYIDTPVKRYSSGMYVRLAFAVAAHLESEIMIVDEVLAVGDAEFQKKCLGKMDDVSKGYGRTVLFVSHNMGSIRKLCSKGLYLRNGFLQVDGSIDNVIANYLDADFKAGHFFESDNNETLPVCVTKVLLQHQAKDLIDVHTPIAIQVEYFVNKPNSKQSIAVRLKKDDIIIFQDFISVGNQKTVDKEKGKFCSSTTNFPEGLLKAGRYSIDIFCGVLRTKPNQTLENAVSFELDLFSANEHDSTYSAARPGVIVLNLEWDQKKIL